MRQGKIFIKVLQVFIQILSAALFVWGLGGVIYFMILAFNKETIPTGAGNAFAPGLIINNLGEGVIIVGAVYAMNQWLNKQKYRVAAYGYLCLCVFIVNFVWNGIVFKAIIPLLKNQAPFPAGDESYDPAMFLYCIAPLLAACLFYYFLNREESRTRKISEQEYQLLHLKQRQTQAELEALQARINPHFLYNALNSIASLIHEEPDRAEQMVLLLSRFFRYSTNGHEGHFDTISQELEIVKTYLEVEKVRFDERLQYDLELMDPLLAKHPIPRFLLQPIVENAIKHGVARSTGQGFIKIGIYQEASSLQIAIHDNGPAFPEHIHMGYGLKSIEEKLRLIYGKNAFLEIQNAPKKQVVIRLPVTVMTPLQPAL